MAGKRGRSPKAGNPPVSPAPSPRVRRRQRSAEARFRKGGTIQQMDSVPPPLAAARAPERGGKPRKV
jgi:hypothetical protein